MNVPLSAGLIGLALPDQLYHVLLLVLVTVPPPTGLPDLVIQFLLRLIV